MSVPRFQCVQPRCESEVSPGYAFCADHCPALKEPAMKLTHIEADADFRQCMEACDAILTKKGHDYTQGSPERLKNFYSTGVKYDVPAAKVLAIYWDKHLNAIETYLKRGQVESEPIETRIYDAINYLLLLYKMLQQEQRDLAEEAVK